MAAKDRKRGGPIPAPGGPPEAERLIAKGRFKDAVKQAKIGFKETPSDANRRLLERAYLLRAQQLRREAMPASAREVAQHLLDFGITDPGLKDEAARLLVDVGLAQAALALQGTQDAPEVRDRLIRQAADQAVLHPEQASATLPEIRPGALRVREALEALEAGDEPRASELLREIGRGSPFADWRLFARGLAASRRRDRDEARASWDRLDPDRAPARIARRLLDLDGSATGGLAAADLGTLEVKVFGEPVLAPLRQFRDHLAQDDWDQALRLLSTVRFKLRRVDNALAERLTRVLLDPLIKAAQNRSEHDAKKFVKSFTQQAEPIPIDPRWNRLWALIWEGPQGDPDTAEDYWTAYIADLERLAALKPDERALAQALVWQRLGNSCLGDDLPELPPLPFGALRPERETDWERKHAVECFEKSIQLAPTLRETYEALAGAYRRWGQPEQAAEVGRRRLAAFPDDFDALIELADHHFGREEPALALDYARRARALRPLDPRAIHEEWAARVALARHLALNERWDEGRAELAAAEALWPDQKGTIHFVARKAAFAIKAGEGERAQALIEEAIGRLAEPTPLWLALRIEATRYRLPKPEQDRFEARWAAGLAAKKVRSETAGALAELVGSFLVAKIAYPERAEHLAQVLDYLRRTTRITYRLDDLTRVCALLTQIPKEQPLREKLVKRGLKLFPAAALFPALTGFAELEKGPFKGNLKLARTQLETALKLAEASSDPNDARLVAELREKLSMLADLTGGPMGLPFGGFGGGPLPPLGELFDMFDMMGDEDDFDEDEDDFDFDFDAAPPRPRPPKKPKKKR